MSSQSSSSSANGSEKSGWWGFSAEEYNSADWEVGAGDGFGSLNWVHFFFLSLTHR